MNVQQLAAGLVLAVAGIGAFITLVLSGHSDQVDKLVAFVGPSIAALLIIGNQNRQHDANQERLAQQDHKLLTIEKQTNGVLDARIHNGSKAAVTEVLQDAGVIPPPTRVDLRP